ncbi:hypothetical protein QE152_g37313 [Popillia japonica]|uniref:Uncharacterized protein n=1 Tax=Popillia japonica TaxID=7064 RepID=A0AAW1IAH4_POPJA
MVMLDDNDKNEELKMQNDQENETISNLESDESSIESSQYNDSDISLDSEVNEEIVNTRYNLRRERKRNTKYDDYEMDVDNVLMIKSDDDDEPLCYDDAASSSDWKQWKKAMEEEISALNENDTWFCVQKDDLLLAGSDDLEISKIKQVLNNNFKMKERKLKIRWISGSGAQELDHHENYEDVVKWEARCEDYRDDHTRTSR